MFIGEKSILIITRYTSTSIPITRISSTSLLSLTPLISPKRIVTIPTANGKLIKTHIYPSTIYIRVGELLYSASYLSIYISLTNEYLV